jgi:hypothetical protein
VRNRLKLLGRPFPSCVWLGVIAETVRKPRETGDRRNVFHVNVICQRSALSGNHQMHVVGHQAVTEQRQAIESAMSSQEIEVHGALIVGDEQELTRVSALRYVVGKVNCYDTS